MKPFLIFLKGLLMGASDVVPGVSGGTIAFITGIYERLIKGIKDLNVSFIWFFMLYLFTKKKDYLRRSQKDFSRIDIVFFIPLGLGIAIAFGIGSKIIPHLIERYPFYLFAFFTGLILGSIKIVIGKAKSIDAKGVVFSVIGFMLAVYLIGLDSLTSNHSLPVIFLSGFVAISAMLLPGISGSFILLMLGQYEYMLHALGSLEVVVISVFMTGAVLGLVSFARLMAYLLQKYHCKTVLFLAGLMIGALRKPLEVIFSHDLTVLSVFFGVSFAVLGVGIVLYIER